MLIAGIALLDNNGEGDEYVTVRKEQNQKIFDLSCLVGYQVAGGSENNAHLSGELRMPVLSPIGSPACSS